MTAQLHLFRPAPADSPTSDPGTADAPAVPEVVEALARRIADLLALSAGEGFLKRLFWETLGWERVNDPVPMSVLPAAERADVDDCTILARCETLPAVYVRLLAPELRVALQAPVLRRLEKAWPQALVVFSNWGATQWDFCWIGGAGGGGAVQRIGIDGDGLGAAELARQLCLLRAYDPATDDELPAAELAARVERLMRRQPPRRRRVPRRLLDSCPLLRELPRWRLLDAAQEKALRSQFEAGESNPARDALIYSNLRLVVDIAARYRGRGVAWDDLLQEGCRGLITAVDRFEPQRGRLSTHAYWWIWQRITRSVAEQGSVVAVPVRMLDAVNATRNYWRESFVTRGFGPTADELACRLDLSPEQFRVVRKAVCARAGYRATSPEIAADRADDPAALAQRRERRGAVRTALQNLHDREADIIAARFGIPDGREQTLEEIGRRLNVTRERVRQIEAQAMKKLQRHFNRRKWEDAHVDA